MLNKNSKGITLLETFLAAFVFVIAVSAIFLVLKSLRKPVIDNDQAVGAALATRTVLEDLRSKIDPSNINSVTGDYIQDLSQAGVTACDSAPYSCPTAYGTGNCHCKTTVNAYKVYWKVTCENSLTGFLANCTLPPCVFGSSPSLVALPNCIRKVEATATW